MCMLQYTGHRKPAALGKMQEGQKKQKKKKNWKDKLLAMVLMFLTGAGVGIIGGILIGRFLGKDAPAYLFFGALTLLLLGFYACLFLHTFLHETGHMLFGLMTGYQFVSIRFFNFMLIKLDGKIKIRKMSLSGTGGQCLMLPPATDGSSPTRWYHWGGCIVNLLTSLLAFFIAIPLYHAVIPWTVLVIFGICGVGTAILNGFPLRSLGNDGYNAMTLSKRKYARIAVEKTLYMNQAIADGMRVKDMPEEWILLDAEAEELFFEMIEKNAAGELCGELSEKTKTRLQTLLDILSDPLVIGLVAVKMGYYMALDDFGMAEKIGRFLLEYTQPHDLHEMSITADLLYMEVVGERRKAVIEELFSPKIQKKMKMLSSMPTMHCVLYAYHMLYEGDIKKAEKDLEMFKKLAAHYPYTSEIEDCREMIALVDKKKAELDAAKEKE